MLQVRAAGELTELCGITCTHTLAAGCCQSLAFLCKKHCGGEVTILSSPFPLLHKSKKKNNIFLRTLLQGSKAFFDWLWPSSFILTRGRKTLKGTLSKLLGLKLALPWQCSHLDGLVLRRANSLSPHRLWYVHPSQALILWAWRTTQSTRSLSGQVGRTKIELFWLSPSEPPLRYVLCNCHRTLGSSKFLFHICKSISVSYSSKKKKGMFSLSKLLDICYHN